MNELSNDTSDNISIFVLTGFRFILINSEQLEGFEGSLSIQLD